jgi:hypothetical protein
VVVTAFCVAPWEASASVLLCHCRCARLAFRLGICAAAGAPSGGVPCAALPANVLPGTHFPCKGPPWLLLCIPTEALLLLPAAALPDA